MIKNLGLIMGFFVLGNVYACDTPTKYCNPKSLSNNDIEIISQAIYKIEGGQKTKYPFGIKSINTNGDYNKAKTICQNTIKNNHIRWNKAGQSGCYLIFLANRYCPPTADKIGNKNWRFNIHKKLK